MRIYTRGGDKGRTGIHGGERVDKDDIRIEANGTLDEVNAQIGIVRALLPPEHEWQDVLGKIQRELMVVMSHVATPSAIRDKNPNSLSEDLVSFCEQQIDLLTGQMQDNGFFILPRRYHDLRPFAVGTYHCPSSRTSFMDIIPERSASGRNHAVRESPLRPTFHYGPLRNVSTGPCRRTLELFPL